MNILSLMSPELIIIDEDITSKKLLFEVIGEKLESTGAVRNKKKIVTALEKREQQVSTGIEKGFGIPHAQSRHVLKPTVLFAKTGEINDYEALDGTKVSKVFCIVVPKGDSGVHLSILSSLSRKLMRDDFREKISSVSNYQEISKILEEEVQ